MPDEKPAQMPDEMLQPPPRHVRDLQLWETGLIIFTDVLVSRKTRETYIRPDTELKKGGISRALVEKTERGLIVTLPDELKGHLSLRDGIEKDDLPVVEIRVVDKNEWEAKRKGKKNA